MNQRTLVLILSGLFLLNSVSTYSKTTQDSFLESTDLSAPLDLKEAVTGLDAEWNAKPSAPFLKGKAGYDFILPGKKSVHIHFPEILNSDTPITIKTKPGDILQYLVSPNTYQAQVMGKYLVYQGNHDAILYRYDADKRQLREFIYLKEASALSENGEVIEWRFEGVDLKARNDGSVLLSKTIDFQKEVRQLSDNQISGRISRFMQKRYGKQSPKKPVEQPILLIPSPEYVTKSGEIRKQGIHYRVEKSNLTVVMASRAPLAYPLWLDPSLSADTDSDVILNGQGAGDQFGWSVNSVGDFNGDGLDDVVLSAPFNDNNSLTDSGTVYIFFGGKTGTLNDPDANGNVILNGQDAGDYFGFSVAPAGDFNGDGLDDVIIGAPMDDNNGLTDSGTAYIYFGGRTGTINGPDANANVILNGQVADDQFGTSVATTKDFNGDGLSDVIVGVPNKDNNSLTDSGTAYIFFGGQTGTINDPETNANVVLNGQGADDRLGSSLAPLGDLNSDGQDDIIVGAPQDDNNGLADSGSAFIFFGGQTGTINNPDTNANTVLNGQGAGDGFGISVSGAGNFLAGFPGEQILVGSLAGKAYIFSGTLTGIINNPDSSAFTRLTDFSGISQFGRSVASVKDFNGDGLDDVIIGAPLFDNNFNNSGSAFIYFGGKSGTINNPDASADLILNGQGTESQLGVFVGPAGDFNGDGLGDFIVGAPVDDSNGQVDAGSAFIRFGRIHLDVAKNNVRMLGQGANDGFGFSVSSAGDFNGDGIDDVIIGVPSDDNNGAISSGSAFIFFGGKTGVIIDPDSNADVVLNGQGFADEFGYSVASIGDFNGDGLSDVIIGAPLDDNGGNNSGSAFIFFGGQTGTINDPDTNADVVLNGEGNNATFGESVASAGDFNGDGLDDVIVGADRFFSGGPFLGSAFIFFGGQTGTINNPVTNANVVLNGQGANDEFGTSVASAGDFNGDDLDDVIVGANLDDNNGLTNSGTAFIFFGGQTGTINNPDVNADVVLNGQNTFGHFGGSVASAGDFNGDGLDDVVVGSSIDDDDGFGNFVTAYIFFGGQTGTINNPDTNADVVLNAQGSNDNFGETVASAGDFNGDGLSDVVVGAFGDENNGNNFAGSAFIFFGGQTGTINDPDINAGAVLNGRNSGDWFGWSVASAGDFNGDGLDDIIIGTRSDGFSNSGSASIFFSPFKVSREHNDLNGDLGSDLLFVQNTGTIASGLLENSVLQTFDGILEVNPAEGWTVNATGDFNSDKRSDLLLYNTTTGEFRTVLLNGSTILNDSVFFALDPSFGLVPQGTGDFDGNGRDEVVTFDPASGFVALIFLDDTGAPSSFEAVTVVDTANDWTLHSTGDYNGDGKTDLLLYNTVSGETWFLEMDGSTVSNTVGLILLDPSTWALEETGDFDGNGNTDLLFLDSSGIIVVITFQRGFFLSFFVPGVMPANSEIVNAGRYNADNKDDLLIRDTVTGNIQTAIQDGSQITSINDVITLDPATGWIPHSGRP